MEVSIHEVIGVCGTFNILWRKLAIADSTQKCVKDISLRFLLCGN